MDALNDNTLMLSVKAGDLDKMGLLFERYHRQLYRYLYHMTGSNVESEDLVQMVFYRMLKYRHTFTGEGAFRSWMYHLTRNVLKDEAKKIKRIHYQADTSTLESLTDSNAYEILVKKEDTINLQLALNQLNTEHREVLVLSKFQEISYKEIAVLFNTTEGNIKVKVFRALQQLRSIYLSTENGK